MEEQQLPPQVTVLVVTQNHVTALRPLLEGLKATPEREILVVDNGSTDGTATLDSEFPDVTILRLPKNFGRTRALNIGTRTAKGERLLLLSPLVLLTPEAADALQQALATLPDAAAVSPLVVDDAGQAVAQAYAAPTADALIEGWKHQGQLSPLSLDTNQERIAVDWVMHSAMLIRRDFVRGMNFFDEKYGDFGPEAELGYQIAKAGKKLYILPSIRAKRVEEARWSPQQAADFAVGAATYLSKRGTGGFGLRLSTGFAALGQGKFGLMMDVLSGQKIDGTQSGA